MRLFTKNFFGVGKLQTYITIIYFGWLFEFHYISALTSETKIIVIVIVTANVAINKNIRYGQNLCKVIYASYLLGKNEYYIIV